MNPEYDGYTIILTCFTTAYYIGGILLFISVDLFVRLLYRLCAFINKRAGRTVITTDDSEDGLSVDAIYEAVWFIAEINFFAICFLLASKISFVQADLAEVVAECSKFTGSPLEMILGICLGGAIIYSMSHMFFYLIFRSKDTGLEALAKAIIFLFTPSKERKLIE